MKPPPSSLTSNQQPGPSVSHSVVSPLDNSSHIPVPPLPLPSVQPEDHVPIPFTSKTSQAPSKSDVPVASFVPVLEYYRSKQQWQNHGFDGPNLELSQRRAIIQKATEQYTIEDIEVEECETDVDTSDYSGTKAPIFYVQSKTDPSCHYEVDLETYTCDCFSFPSIKFCKHICAMQQLYGGTDLLEYSSSSLQTMATLPPSSPSLSNCDIDSPVLADLSLPNLTSINNEPSIPSINAQAVDSMECFSARLRHDPTWTSPDPNLFTVVDLIAQLDCALSLSQDSNVLPSKQKVPPNRSTAQETRSTMPRMKQKKQSNVDSIAYGGGSNSGSKAKSRKCVKLGSPANAAGPA
ncbi:hypothetical protein BDP27DRAFT_1432967 [Rhodocollybia butyracea]|uniref:SWIM-type domain-containing protein n=1 Tax=Rhodocollybia butyracea TaxID=206335 RepID=A0A9P5TXK5_9AGAR|nr:hypothetical protein BDP27DRAFT_1432967 [Rhodocollybia butyracea]